MIVIGAGIVGAACAREYARQGLSVAVIEQGAVGAGATAASMGHLLCVDAEGAPDTHEYQLSQRSMQLWAEWLAESPAHGEAAEHDQCGTLWLAADEEEMQAALRKQAWWREVDQPTELLDADQLQRAEPLLRAGLFGALHVPADARVYPPRVVARWLEESRATLVRGEVVDIQGSTVRLADGRRLWGALIVLCGGLASQRFLPAGCLQPKKGQLAITQRSGSSTVRHQLVELGYLKNAHRTDEDTVSFNLQPRPGGQLLIGSSRQLNRDDTELDLAMLQRMLAHAGSFVPTLPQMSLLRCWSGIRPASRDGQPLIGAHPRLERVWVACGHEGLGITTSLATAELLAHLSLAQTPLLDASPYSPTRFAATP
ncbi:FAD-dependent oxidoreductase [Pelomonas sp. SE-A7]|uniref:NAD(P)/FAD-dependent oxidoreductase n=1 Tax=Pelomonas sp. SE-A7 TaxID=3054953 RepID=UPI00259D26AD|nr:FAD-dependent oxidoreductase [Pelomonas sp. SE-A7]MDM4766754.1 FAD-dependent oxidoreductase [Pelomonas sp. SE-A7]